MIAKRLSSKWFGLLLITAAALWIAGCGPVKPPDVTEISVEPGTDILAGETASLTVQATGRNLQFNWTALRGKLSPQTGPAVIYTAPDTPGPDTVSVEVTSDGASTVRTIAFNIIPPPTATPTFTPTATPTPTPTETPTPTPTAPPPTPTPETPTPIPTTPPPTPTPETPTPIPTAPPPTPTPPVIGESGVYCTDSGGGGTETIAVEPPRTVARIRIDMEEKATEYGDSLLEVEAYGPDTGNTNLVKGGKVFDVSSEQNSPGCVECFAYKAIDGKMDTRWSSKWYDPQHLEIALPDPKLVNRIVLIWETAYARRYCVTVIEP